MLTRYALASMQQPVGRAMHFRMAFRGVWSAMYKTFWRQLNGHKVKEQPHEYDASLGHLSGDQPSFIWSGLAWGGPEWYCSIGTAFFGLFIDPCPIAPLLPTVGLSICRQD